MQMHFEFTLWLDNLMNFWLLYSLSPTRKIKTVLIWDLRPWCTVVHSRRYNIEIYYKKFTYIGGTPLMQMKGNTEGSFMGFIKGMRKFCFKIYLVWFIRPSDRTVTVQKQNPFPLFYKTHKIPVETKCEPSCKRWSYSPIHLVISEKSCMTPSSVKTYMIVWCVRQVGLLSTAGVDSWEDLLLVREDRSELTSGVSALAPAGLPSSYVGNG